MLADEMYKHLDRRKLLPEEQKGCRKDSRGTKNQLLVDKMIIKNCKRKLTGLGMVRINFKKALDMVPHSWIIQNMFGIAKNMIVLLQNSMKKWIMELTAGKSDSLSPLLFVTSLIPLTLVLRKIKASYDLGKGNQPSVIYGRPQDLWEK